MRVNQIEVGGMAQMEPNIWAERVTPKLYRRCWGRRCPEGMVPFAALLPNDKLDWWLVEAAAEVTRVGSVKEMVGRN